MRILVYGGGVVGRLYAARLQAAGNDVHVLARGAGLAELQRDGIVLVDGASGQRSVTRVGLVEQLGPDDDYDLVMVTVRMDQLDEILPVLADNRGTQHLLFMLNNPGGAGKLGEAVGRDRVLLGFPGAGGAREVDGAIRYILIAQQPTTLGEPDGTTTPRLELIKAVFVRAGFPVAISRSIEDWLKTHSVFISCVGAAIIGAGGDNVRLADDRAAVKTMIRAVREGFAALASTGVRVTPSPLKAIFSQIPYFISVPYWRNALRSRMTTIGITPHVTAAPGERRLLADQALSLVRSAAMPIPTLTSLLSYPP